MDFLTEAEMLFEYTRDLRRDFHRNPELGYHETRTAGIIARELNSFGLTVTTGVAGTGVVGLLEGKQPGPVVLLRFDMDALPVDEQTGLEYASQNPGVMHACGHDAHIAAGITAARLLKAHHKDINGQLKFVFQPAEEMLGGAERMIAEGVLRNPCPDYTLAMHVWNARPVGWLGIVPGAFMAGNDGFEIAVKGRGGHGAAPHEANDPVLAAAHIITSLQSIVSRNVSPLETAVVSVTCVHAGDAGNVIPQTAQILGTIRYFSSEIRELIWKNMQEIARGVASGMGCEAEVKLKGITPPVVNDPGIAKRLGALAAKAFPELIVDTQYKTMISEDMAFMQKEIPGCYILTGSSNLSKGLNAGHHHPLFDIDEAVLPIAASFMAAAAIELLNQSE
jgi:amidohydrolase